MKLNIYKLGCTTRLDTEEGNFYIKDSPTAISIEVGSSGYNLRFHPLREGEPLIATWFGELSISPAELEELKIKIEELLASYPKADIGAAEQKPDEDEPLTIAVSFSKLSQVQKLIHGIEFPQVTFDDDSLKMAKDSIRAMRRNAGQIRHILDAIMNRIS